MAQTQTKQSQLLEILNVFLDAYGEPMHYKELTQVIIDGGLWEPYGQKPDQIVYSAMSQDIKRRGEWSAFRLINTGDKKTGGVFCSSNVKGVEEVAKDLGELTVSQPSIRRKGDTDKDVQRRISMLEANARCGNCTHIEYIGPEKYAMRYGACNAWPNSGQPYVFNHQEPCPLHRKASLELMEARQRDRDANKMILIEHGMLRIDSDARVVSKVRKNNAIR